MRQIDLTPDEFEVVLIGSEDLPPPPSPFDIINQSFEQLTRSFMAFGESLRHMAPLWHRMQFSEEPPREPHHMQFIEQHIRRTRKPRK